MDGEHAPNSIALRSIAHRVGFYKKSLPDLRRKSSKRQDLFTFMVHMACLLRSACTAASSQPSSRKMASVCSPTAGTASMR